jgi:transcriptional regulator with XRE-family HTH domain
MANEFGDLLGRQRTAAGLTQGALAKLVAVDQSYINRLEHGEREPPKRELVARLATALGLDDAERQRLLLAAGHVPDWLLVLEPNDPTLLAVARFLAAPTVSPAAKADFRAVLALLLARWRVTGDEPVAVAGAAVPTWRAGNASGVDGGPALG